jgi:lysophospholipid acyltransferase (LPLAT)-like uncharacterized protein
VKIRSTFVTNLVSLLTTAAIRGWMGSLDHKWACYEPRLDPASPDCRGQKIYVFWHEYILAPLSIRGHCNLSMLLSRHRDADYLARIAAHMGFDCIRGSSYHGGTAALRELIRKSRSRHLTLTPDGPRGPRREAAMGPIYLASKLEIPLVCAGIGYDRPWRLGTWDRFAIPRPGSRARGILSPAITVPANLDRDGFEHYRREVQRFLNRLTAEAEAWAESGTAKLDEMPVHRGPTPQSFKAPTAIHDMSTPASDSRIHLPPAA